MTDAREPGATYRCPECGTENADVTEYEDDGARVHIYCEDSDCGWVHRGLYADGSIVNNA